MTLRADRAFGRLMGLLIREVTQREVKNPNKPLTQGQHLVEEQLVSDSTKHAKWVEADITWHYAGGDAISPEAIPTTGTHDVVLRYDEGGQWE